MRTICSCDNGPELTANALRDWCRFTKAGSAYIEPGSPWQNPYVESFGSRVRDELLGVELFSSLTEAKVMVADWRHDYNHHRPHSSLQMLTPARFARSWREGWREDLETAQPITLADPAEARRTPQSGSTSAPSGRARALCPAQPRGAPARRLWRLESIRRRHSIASASRVNSSTTLQELQDAAVGGLVELEVERPDLIGALGAQAGGRHRRLTEAAALAPAHGDPQPLFAPQPLAALAVEGPALIDEASVTAAIAPARTLTRDLAQASAQRAVVRRQVGLAALGRAVLAGDLTRPPLGEAETILEHQDRLPPARRAQKFPFAISLSATFSSSLSATIRFSVTFSSSSSFKRLTSSALTAFIPPNCARQR